MTRAEERRRIKRRIRKMTPEERREHERQFAERCARIIAEQKAKRD